MEQDQQAVVQKEEEQGGKAKHAQIQQHDAVEGLRLITADLQQKVAGLADDFVSWKEEMGTQINKAVASAIADSQKSQESQQGQKAPEIIPVNRVSLENMPGGDVKDEISRILGVSAASEQPVDVAEVEYFSGSDLGKQSRTVVDSDNIQGRVIKLFTYEPCKVYEAEFINGRAQVPPVIADYINRENPGGTLRTV